MASNNSDSNSDSSNNTNTNTNTNTITITNTSDDGHAAPPVPGPDPKAPRDYVQFPCLPPGGPLNRWSAVLTRAHDFPGAQAMLYGAGVPSREVLQRAPQIGIATVWWEGNPCNTHLLELGRIVKRAVEEQGMLAWQYNTVGVSDAITMGGDGMRFSLQTRELIADSIETVTLAQHHDGCIAIPGCDKNMPGVVMAAARHNRPFIMVYGGSTRRGHSALLGRGVDISSCYEAAGALAYGTLRGADAATPPAAVLDDVARHACPGPGACGGMFTANTMAAAFEAMGLTLPGSSSFPAASPEKARECARAGALMASTTLARDHLRPRDLLTRAALENALVLTMALGGSTNAVLHLLAVAHAADVPLALDDVARASARTPLLADLAPGGRFLMEDLFAVGGVPAVLKLLIAARLVDGAVMTVTGRSLAANVADWPSLDPGQRVVRPLADPRQPRGHIRVLRGSLAPGGAVAKISGAQGLVFAGAARVFDGERALNDALAARRVRRDAGPLVLVVRYEGPRGGPGMPEQLRASAAIMGARLTNVALVTDGRYSGASHGFIVGHVVPEAALGGPIALVRDGDPITIDAAADRIDVAVPDPEMARRRAEWTPPAPRVRRGVLAKYAKLVGDASHGAVTDAPEP